MDVQAVWKSQLRQMVNSDDLPSLKEAFRNGQNLGMVIDDSGSTALTLAISLAHEDVVDFLLQALKPVLEQEDVLSACLTALHSLARTRNTHYLQLLNTLMTCHPHLHIPYVVVLQAAFKILQAPPKDMLVLFCEMALKLSPDLCRDISLNLVLYEETECYWQLLSRGVSLNDLWPVNCSELGSKDYMAHNLFDIYFTYGCLFTVHTSSRNKITKMTIQAANGEASRAVLHVIQNFPTDLYDDVFKFLTLAGFTMSQAAVQRMANVEIDKAAELIRWYKDFHCRPHSLKHLCRLCVRQHLRFNVVHAVQQILLPEDLKRYLLITDPNSF
ncbi:hypothetical protein C0Q70_10937 [Pomacea canaliculata]|uniref:SOCS box domain-containing protein n=2 Tax=Pomacea canaliculata TaxID=400727 RepID=A0A2T7P4L2_POMCA|nr:hypothetical protein C0Q70_10937 [Pomacea canaliculata]